MQGNWIEVKIIADLEILEPITGIFYGLDVKGLAIEDPSDILDKNQSYSWDYTDDNLFEYGETKTVVKGYFSEDDKLEQILEYISEKLSELTDMGIDASNAKVLHKLVKEDDWATSWKKYYKTTKLGSNIVIKPTWEDYEVQDGEIVIELDPGMAFGTGTHETTSMCIELMEKYLAPTKTVFDIGTGSGILSIAASKLGAKAVVGVDLDEVAVNIARENVEVNKLSNVEIKYGNLVDVIEGKADLIVANIMADIVVYLNTIVGPFFNKEGIYITSGIIQSKKDEVLASLAENSFEVIEVFEKGEWVAIAAKAL